MNFDDNNSFDSLLDDPIDNVQDVETDVQTDVEPLLPDQESDNLDNNNPDNHDNDNPDNAGETDLISEFLKFRGIEDPSKIKFENEDGGVDEVDFSTLSKEEQLTMLKELSASDYSDYEKSVINFLRRSNTDLQGVIDYYSQKAIDDYLNENPDKKHQKSYSVDDYSDDELYVADLRLKFPNFSDEEIQDKLESAKANEELYNKEVTSLRETYKAQEDKEAEDAKLKEQQQYENLQRSLLDAASRFTEIKLDVEDPKSDAFDVEDEERQKALGYLLGQDKDGLSQFDKDLNNPMALFEIAYLRTSGRDLINNTTRYYKGLLADTRKKLEKANKELEKYTKKTNDNDDDDKKNTVVVKTPDTKAKKHDLFDTWIWNN